MLVVYDIHKKCLNIFTEHYYTIIKHIILDYLDISFK